MVVGLTTGLVIAFVYGWLVTILILLTLPLLLGALVIQSRLLMGVTGTKKNDEAENVSIVDARYLCSAIHVLQVYNCSCI